MRERERETERERQRDRQTDRQTEGQRDRETERTERERERPRPYMPQPPMKYVGSPTFGRIDQSIGVAGVTSSQSVCPA
jgi:hypothetical protein